MILSRKGQSDPATIAFIVILIASAVALLVYLYSVGTFGVAPGVPSGIFSPIFAFFSRVNSLVLGIVVLAIGSLLILFGVIIAGSSVRTGRIIAYIGAAIFLLGIFALEMTQIFVAQSNLFSGSTSRINCSYCSGNPNDIGDKISCIISGYSINSSSSNLAIVGFWVFGIIVPLVLLFYIFREFVEASMIIRSQTAQGFIALAFALLAFRGFLASRLIEVISVGTTGIAILAIDIIFAGGLFGFIGRAFLSWKGVDDALGAVRADIKIKHELIQLADAGILAAKNKNEGSIADIAGQMMELSTDNIALKTELKTIVTNKSDFNYARKHFELIKSRL